MNRGSFSVFDQKIDTDKESIIYNYDVADDEVTVLSNIWFFLRFLKNDLIK